MYVFSDLKMRNPANRFLMKQKEIHTHTELNKVCIITIDDHDRINE